MAKFVSADESSQVDQVRGYGCNFRFMGMGHPEEISLAMEKRFLEFGEPRDLTLTHGASQNDGKSNWGLNRWARKV